LIHTPGKIHAIFREFFLRFHDVAGFHAVTGARQTLGDYAPSSPAVHLPATPTVATIQGLPDGPEAVPQTLRLMRNYARAAIRSPDQTVRNQALGIVQNVAARNYSGEVNALQQWVRDQIRYVQDPTDSDGGIELVQTPEKTLELGQGDCDDKSTLLASLLIAIGHPARFVAVGFNGDAFSHVLVESKVGASWIPLETIIPVQAGWYPPGVTSRYVLNV
jgi:transglutaminase-like putative cysteine protease